MFESARMYDGLRRGERPQGVSVGQAPVANDAGPDLALLLLTGFALAAGAGIFHGIAWGLKRLAKGETMTGDEEETT